MPPLPIKFQKLTFRNKGNKVLGVTKGTHSTETGTIILWDSTDAHDQWIHFQKNEDETYSLFFLHSSLCLAVPQSSHKKDTELCQFHFSQINDQKWYLKPQGTSGYWKLQNAESKLYLAVEKNGSNNGNKFCQWDDLDEDGQFFSLHEEIHGYFDPS